ncbi:aquaporin-5-like [Denticeps clupeoides]|uniref:Uncharacterized protein n=1 Tax=Denticeps clupeoides TaxID=299321 RepID=A0AAY4E436_9TELE|nr:aquaporin-5-like [Denticeps clupeoides]
MKVLSRLTLVLKDMVTLSFLQDVLREFLGTVLFLLIGLSSIVLWPSATAGDTTGHGEPAPFLPLLKCHLDPLRVPLAFGAALAVACVCFGPVHLNPAVTLALAMGLRVSPWRAVLYIGAQLLGALTACALLMGIAPTSLHGQLGINEVAPGVNLSKAVCVEMAITVQLVLCVLTISHPMCPCSSLGPALFGLSVTLGHFVAMEYTGCGMNPARSFGPAMMTLNFNHQWVYWVGPCVGAVLAWLLHDLLLRPRWSSTRDWLSDFKKVFLQEPQKQPDDTQHAAAE